MSWDDFNKVSNTKVREPLIRSTNHPHYYAIFRIGKKYKEMDGKQNSGLNLIKNFQKHMEREINVTNADANIQNEILIGDKNIYANVKEYIKDVKLRKNSVIARELLMSASPDFYKGLMKQDLELWKTENIKFLQDNFDSNCIYATLHKDESTWHIHALIVPKFMNKKNEFILSNTRYFDGIEKMRSWQDNYSQSMQQRFKCLNRGIKYSKAKHIEIKKWYAFIKQNTNIKDTSQLLAKVQEAELQTIKMKSVQKTLEIYKNYDSKSIRENDILVKESKELVKEIEILKTSNNTYKEAISVLSQQYRIPQYIVKEIIKECNHVNEHEK